MAKEKRQALPARHELKYFINAAEVQALRMRLFPVMEMDSHCKNGPYAIRSLYFDDIYGHRLVRKRERRYEPGQIPHSHLPIF